MSRNHPNASESIQPNFDITADVGEILDESPASSYCIFNGADPLKIFLLILNADMSNRIAIFSFSFLFFNKTK